jgi:hypothetical protein
MAAVEINDRYKTFTAQHFYQKPTTSTIIHRTSCHLTKHKIAALNCLFSRLDTYPLPNTEKNKALDIWQIVIDNNYHPSA